MKKKKEEKQNRRETWRKGKPRPEISQNTPGGGTQATEKNNQGRGGRGERPTMGDGQNIGGRGETRRGEKGPALDIREGGVGTCQKTAGKEKDWGGQTEGGGTRGLDF